MGARKARFRRGAGARSPATLALNDLIIHHATPPKGKKHRSGRVIGKAAYRPRLRYDSFRYVGVAVCGGNEAHCYRKPIAVSDRFQDTTNCR